MNVASLVTAVLTAIAVQLGAFFFRLGYFLVYVWLFGLLATIAITYRQSAKSKSLLSAVALIYCAALFLSYHLFFNWKATHVRSMTWQNKGTGSASAQSEIVLQFVDYPDNFVGIYSNDLADYLSRLGQNPVQVSFEVTSDLGCVRGYNVTAVGGLQSWKSASSYSLAKGKPQSPWKTKPWCYGG